MIYIINDSNDPHFNLAFEEYIFNNADPNKEYILLWQNRPTVVVGKHQNTIEEINAKYIYENDIDIVRRLSGGGAVYHDSGNLNFTYIISKDNVEEYDFKRFTTPVVNALNSIGVKAEFNSRNDLVIDGRKFSGNSQYVKQNKILHHGTLLFDSDLSELGKTLKVSKDKFVSKGIKSVKSRVTNISEHLEADISLNEFKELVLRSFAKKDLVIRGLSEVEREEIERLANEKYRTWGWNYGESPKFNIKKTNRFDFGKVEVYINVDNGIIKNCKIYGDFFGDGNMRDIEQELLGCKYCKEDISHRLAKIEIGRYFLGICKDDIVELVV